MKKGKFRCMCCDKVSDEAKAVLIPLNDKSADVYVCPKCAKDHPERVKAQDWCSHG